MLCIDGIHQVKQVRLIFVSRIRKASRGSEDQASLAAWVRQRCPPGDATGMIAVIGEQLVLILEGPKAYVEIVQQEAIIRLGGDLGGSYDCQPIEDRDFSSLCVRNIPQTVYLEEMILEWTGCLREEKVKAHRKLSAFIAALENEGMLSNVDKA